MKNILTFFFLVLFSFYSNAQKWENGSTRINIGLGSIYGLGVVGSIDKGIADNISVGVGASASRYGYLGYNATYFSVGGRGSYHLGKILEDAGVKIDKLDSYLGLNVSYFFGTGNAAWGSYNGFGGIRIGGHGGLRYQFSDKLNLMVEGGFPYSSIGLSFKLGK
jgi:hypothetical protein